MNDQGIDNEITGTNRKQRLPPCISWHRLGHIIAVKFCQKSLSDLTDQKFVPRAASSMQIGSKVLISYCGIQADILAML